MPNFDNKIKPQSWKAIVNRNPRTPPAEPIPARKKEHNTPRPAQNIFLTKLIKLQELNKTVKFYLSLLQEQARRMAENDH